MLKLRKILLHDNLYIIISIFVIVLSLLRLNYKTNSKYSINTKSIEGVITNITKNTDNITIELKAKEKILINYYLKSNEKLILSIGDKIKVIGIVNIPTNNTNRYLFNYKKYLERKKIYIIFKANKIIILNKNKNIYYKIKQLIINRLSNNYLKTFIIGDKSNISNEIIRSYQENGISHLFAISGMHISLLAEIMNRILKKIKMIEENRFKITTLVLLIYLILVGLSPSILRGVLFYIFFSINKIYYFYIKPINLYLVIVSISLIINPNFIFDIAFQYSYLISISLILKSNYLKSNNYIISLLKTSIISFIVSIPITLYNYYQLNLLSIIYNLFYVPLISIIIFPFTLIVFIFKPLLPIYEFLIMLLEKTSLFLSNINILKLYFVRLPVFVYFIYLLVILLYIIRNKKIYLIILFFILTIHLITPYIHNHNYVYYLDVGQGDSTFIRINKNNIIIDTGGNNDLFYNTIYPSIKSNFANKIDYLILTHGDYDHMGEAINIVKKIKVKNVIFNCGEFNELEQELIKVLDKDKIPYYTCIKELNIDNNKLYFLQTNIYDNENDNSNVIYTKIDGYKFMFMGDAGIEKENDILTKYNISNIDVLKVGHHGSKTSSSKKFINEMNPKYSIISVGKNNRYGHPNKEVINNLNNSIIYRTDEDGSIMFKIKNNKLKIETCTP